MKSYYIWTIGCQMNAADSQRAAEALEGLGLRAVPRAEEADLIVLNTCVVRQSAEDKAIGRLTSLKVVKRRRPNATIAVMGCLVGDEVTLREQYPFVDVFFRPSDVEGLARFVEGRLHCQTPSDEKLWVCRGDMEGMEGRASCYPVAAFVPIMHGCDHHCTYCIVRLRRGPGRSIAVAKVVVEVQQAVAKGAREVTLLGQNIDAYGKDLPERPDLADLLRAVHEIEGLYRIRFLTSHPAEMSDRVIEAVAELSKVCKHFELPVQAGDDAVLRRMGRGYTIAAYRELVSRIRTRIPQASIATDVIVGFPGETEAQFTRTLALLEDLRFDAVHVAAYSPRPGTPAARLLDDVPPEEKERRRQAVEALQERIVREINAQLLGQTVEVLVEERQKGRWKGRTRSNKLVFFEDSDDWRGKLARVRIAWAGAWSLIGEAA